MDFLLYGANGYTGTLVAEAAVTQGLKPVLAGRTEDKLRPLAKRLGLDYKVIDLSDEGTLDAALSQAKVVLHCAGPFKFTGKPMMKACMRTQTHYLDITGEIEIFELAYYLGKKAKEAGIMLMPGAGFDVVPTDCMALFLKNKMPDATHLKLAFASIGSGLSRGTATTMAVNLGKGSAVRKDGKIIPAEMGGKTLTLDVEGKKLLFMTIPWGDVSTAFRSTGIPNIETYAGSHPKQVKKVKMMNRFNWLLRMDFMRKMAVKRIQKQPPGPTAEQRAKAKSFVWGEVTNAAGETASAQLITRDGYTLTAQSSLHIVKQVLAGNASIGFQTPAMAYGEDLVMQLEGVSREELKNN